MEIITWSEPRQALGVKQREWKPLDPNGSSAMTEHRLRRTQYGRLLGQAS